MLKGRSAMHPNVPTPDDVEHAHFILKFAANWWSEFLLGVITVLSSVYFRKKGRDTKSVIIPLSEEHIDNKMKICQQDMLILIGKQNIERDAKTKQDLNDRDNKLLDHIRDMIK